MRELAFSDLLLARSTGGSWLSTTTCRWSSIQITVPRNCCPGSMECWRQTRSTLRQMESLCSHLTCWIYLKSLMQKTSLRVSSTSNGEPLFSSHMLDLSEEFDAEN